ncbi:MAG: thioesterase family protein [Oscillospiraceae bacterium]|nr:thioesterase family protein [Oscillospiraceae bacterium]
MTVTKSQVCVRYAETDQMGVVHHAVYPVWFELARTDFIKTIGMTYSKMEEMGILMPVAELTCRYRIPARYEDELTVETYIQRITPARIVFGYRIYKTDDPEQTVMVEGTSTHAWADANLHPMNMKKAYPSLYGQIAELAQ